MTVVSLALAFVAGVLSILSPCVLPILPIVLGAAASEHRLGPVALAAGLAVSFVAIGLFAATAGYSIGLNADVFRNAAAALMIGVGDGAAGAAFSGVARARRRAARELDRPPFRRRAPRRSFRPGIGGAAARRRLEPLCGPDARSGIDPRRAGS